MTVDELAGDFDCARWTPDVAAVADLLWGDADLAVVLIDADRRLLAFNPAAVPSLADENVQLGGPLTQRLRQIWLDDEVDECPPERNPLVLGLAGQATRRQLVRFSTESFQEQGRMRVSVLPVALHDGSRGVLIAWHEMVAGQRRDQREIRRLGELLAAQQEILSLNTRLRTLNQELEGRIAERTEQLLRQAADLQAANAELATFSYSVSHNLRAPLRAIGGYARLIEERYADRLPAEAIGYLVKLTRSATTMGQLIDGLLELSRTQRTGLDIEPLDMVALVQECWEALSEDRAGRVIDLSVGDLPPVDGDRRLIYQVWVNLLQNAIKYTGTRGQARISVTAAVRDGVTSYRVEDNGVGFDMRYAHKIGQVFQRLHESSQFPGTGIGMATVQRIVHRHGGAVTVHGAPDAGATIEFSLWGRR